jgi:hypothetical protein
LRSVLEREKAAHKTALAEFRELEEEFPRIHTLKPYRPLLKKASPEIVGNIITGRTLDGRAQSSGFVHKPGELPLPVAIPDLGANAQLQSARERNLNTSEISRRYA